MSKIIDGTISSGGIHDALEAVSQETNVKHGVLRVVSDTCSGVIGVFCGRFITGAVLTLSGKSGIEALRDLLAAKDGTFEFIDVSDNPVREVNQSLGVDLQALLASPDLTLEGVLSSEGDLTPRSAKKNQVRLIDTSLETDSPLEDLSIENLEDFGRTEWTADEDAASSAVPEGRASRKANPDLLKLDPSQPPAADYAISYDSGAANSAEVQAKDSSVNRLRAYPGQNKAVTFLIWGVVIVAVVAGAVVYGPHVPATTHTKTPVKKKPIQHHKK